MPEIIGEYQFAKDAFDKFTWHGGNGKKFEPTKAKTAYTITPEQTLSAVAGIEIAGSEELAILLEQIQALNLGSAGGAYRPDYQRARMARRRAKADQVIFAAAGTLWLNDFFPD